MDENIFLEIPFFNDYEVNAYGLIRRMYDNYNVPIRNYGHYNKVTARRNIDVKSSSYHQHVLVALAWVPGWSPELIVNHKDGVKNK